MMTRTGLPVAERWYETRDMGDGVSLILESHVAPWLRCNIWHIKGRDRDVLLDSGLGLRPLQSEVAKLGGRSASAVCTHCHFDHMGCAHEFGERLGHVAEADIFASPDNHRTCATPWLAAGIITALPHEGYDISSYRLTPAPLTGYLDEGDVIDLGDRHFQVFHLPGHSPGSIALYEARTRILFSGDVIYDGQLIDNAWHSDADMLRHSLARLRELPVDTVHAGHEPSFGRKRLHELIDSYMAGGLRMPPIAEWLAARGA